MQTFLKNSLVLGMFGSFIIKSARSISDAVALSISLLSLVERYDSQPIPVSGLKSPEGSFESEASAAFSGSGAGLISSRGSFAGAASGSV